MRSALAIVAFLAAQEAGAQMFKCIDAAGKTTYSSSACNTLGLKDAGPVPNRLQITPAPPPPPVTSAPSARPQREEAKPKPAAEPPTEPEKRCHVHVGKDGKRFWRCNDKPDEE
jgi:hypothetical protein